MSAQPAAARPSAQLVDVQPAHHFNRFVAREYRYILENTLQPFAPGDIFLGCTYLNDPTDDHAGLGRILQYDASFKPKGVLWTEGHRHLVMGLNFDREGVLWGFDIHTQAVLRVDPLLLDMRAERDYDRVVALFRRNGCWGAISKTNGVFLRWRDPVYRSLRELALSYSTSTANGATTRPCANTRCPTTCAAPIPRYGRAARSTPGRWPRRWTTCGTSASSTVAS